MRKWEYKVVTMSFEDDTVICERLRDLGEVGWELSSSIRYDSGDDFGQLTMILKRPKSDDDAAAGPYRSRPAAAPAVGDGTEPR